MQIVVVNRTIFSLILFLKQVYLSIQHIRQTTIMAGNATYDKEKKHLIFEWYFVSVSSYIQSKTLESRQFLKLAIKIRRKAILKEKIIYHKQIPNTCTGWRKKRDQWAILSNCKYSENSMTEFRGNW